MSTTNNNTNPNMGYDWTDTIDIARNNLTILDEGDYDFTITALRRGRFPGGPKVPACNMASITLRIETPDGPVYVYDDLLLHQIVAWRLVSFFQSIGPVTGDQITMDWDSVPGAQGRAHIRPRTYPGKDGQERQKNEVVRYLPYDPDRLPF